MRKITKFMMAAMAVVSAAGLVFPTKAAAIETQEAAIVSSARYAGTAKSNLGDVVEKVKYSGQKGGDGSYTLEVANSTGSIVYFYDPKNWKMSITENMKIKKKTFSWTLTYDTGGNGTPQNSICATVMDNKGITKGEAVATISPINYRKGDKMTFKKTSGSITDKELKKLKKQSGAAMTQIDTGLKKLTGSGLKGMSFTVFE